jgi:hypothetical protein
MGIKKNQVQTLDSWTGLFQPKTYNFFTMSSLYDVITHSHIAPDLAPPNLADIIILENEEMSEVTRIAHTWIDILADIGGLLEIMVIFTTIIVAN